MFLCDSMGILRVAASKATAAREDPDELFSKRLWEQIHEQWDNYSLTMRILKFFSTSKQCCFVVLGCIHIPHLCLPIRLATLEDFPWNQMNSLSRPGHLAWTSVPDISDKAGCKVMW